MGDHRVFRVEGLFGDQTGWATSTGRKKADPRTGPIRGNAAKVNGWAMLPVEGDRHQLN